MLELANHQNDTMCVYGNAQKHGKDKLVGCCYTIATPCCRRVTAIFLPMNVCSSLLYEALRKARGV